jgi:hypothetical protein
MLRRVVGPKRRPDDWTTPHERALVRLSDRLDGPLDPDEALWLERHLDACEDCSSAAVAYQEERELLRALPMPEPPRDLFARTMTAIDTEEARRRGGGGVAVLARRLAPYGALGSVLIVALVVGATAFAPVTNIDVDGPGPAIPTALATSLPSTVPSARPPATPEVTPRPPAPTPIALPDVGPVSWARPADDGSYAVTLAAVGEVCAPEAAPDCAPIDSTASAVVTIDETPAQVVAAPGGSQFVVADATTRQAGGSIFALALAPTGDTGPDPSAEPSVSPSPEASPSLSPEPSIPASFEPSPSPLPVERLAILDDVVLVGEMAAYSPSGTWFAFTARPADGSHGPDVYVWRSDWTEARALTDDHLSVFASWLGERILASRVDESPAPVPSASPAALESPATGGSSSPSASPSPSSEAAQSEQRPVESILIDPESGTVSALPSDAIWRPSVDPDGRFVVYWDGTVVVDEDGLTVSPAEGRLVVARFDATAESIVSDPVTLVDGRIGDWDARWDEHGGRLALWVADPEVAGVGELDAYSVDPSTGIDLNDPLLADVIALPGLSIGHGRLAWATPPGQGGEGSRLQVLAWSGDDAGTVSSDPGPGDAPVIVVR